MSQVCLKKHERERENKVFFLFTFTNINNQFLFYDLTQQWRIHFWHWQPVAGYFGQRWWLFFKKVSFSNLIFFKVWCFAIDYNRKVEVENTLYSETIQNDRWCHLHIGCILPTLHDFLFFCYHYWTLYPLIKQYSHANCLNSFCWLIDCFHH